MQSPSNLKRFFTRAGLVVALGVTAAASSVDAQTWNYQGAQHIDAFGPAVMGQISLEEVGGEYRFRMQHLNADPCYRSPMKASVERAPSTITITPAPLVRGCDQVRFVLNTDGTGGFREFLSDGQWRREEANRVLTLRK